REIRGKALGEIVAVLRKRLEMEQRFADNPHFRLHGTNRPQVHRILARLTDYVETQSGHPSRYEEYARRGPKGYEIEHIWADHPHLHLDRFSPESDVRMYRNRIGGRLLRPKSFNASYGDLPYQEKRRHYLAPNLLARGLHEQAYEHHPGFLRFIR